MHISLIRNTIYLLLILMTVKQVNGQAKYPYQDPSMPEEQRVKDLLSRMTLKEKVGQVSILPGWEMYQKNGTAVASSSKFKKALREQHTGMLWATLRADPWTRKTLLTGLNPGLAAEATNALQKFAIENSRLGIPLFFAEECPHGHMAIGTTVFPTSIGQSSTWNPALIQKMAAAIAKEARLQGAHIGYGPVLDLAREPRWSRVEETYGEDPVLSSAMGVAMVKGFQGGDLRSKENVISTLKHFAAYGDPEGGHNGNSVSIGMRELQQSYLPPFKAAIDAGALSVMTAYNSVDGVPCSSNSFLLKDVLREAWGFAGLTVSDLGSISGLVSSHQVAANAAEAAAMALNAGLDLDLSGYGYGEALLQALKKGQVNAGRLDSAVANILKLKFRMGLFENPFSDPELAAREVRNADHVSLARTVAQESIILLKNHDRLLPLRKDLKSIAVIGPNADNIYNLLGDYTAPQSEQSVVTVLEGIKAKVAADTRVTYVKGCAIRDTSADNIHEAVEAARNAEVAIVVLGGSSARDFKTEYQATGAAKVIASKEAISDMESGEGYDRASLDLLGKQLHLLKEVYKTGTPIVLVLIKGRPLSLNWPDEHIPAILDAWYPGQEGGNAIADVLFGDYNPAGRLPISVPRSVGQLPVYYNSKKPLPHDYVEMDSRPLYSFGHGLSYSEFIYDDLQIRPSKLMDSVSVSVRFTVENIGSLAGDEVVQLYLQDIVSSTVSPYKQLKNFRRLHLHPSEKRTIEFKLSNSDLMILDRDMNWRVEPGEFKVMIGGASDSIKIQDKFAISEM